MGCRQPESRCLRVAPASMSTSGNSIRAWNLFSLRRGRQFIELRKLQAVARDLRLADPADNRANCGHNELERMKKWRRRLIGRSAHEGNWLPKLERCRSCQWASNRGIA